MSNRAVKKETDVKSSSPRKGQEMTVKSEAEAESIVVPVLERSVTQLSDRTGADVTAASFERMRSNFVRMEKGSRRDDRTPLWHDIPRANVVKGADKRVNKNVALLGITPDFEESWFEIEEGQKANIGPMSMFVPASEDCKEKIGAVMSDKPLNSKVNWAAYQKALLDVRNMLPSNSIHAVPIEEAYVGSLGDSSNALDPTTNSGWPFCLPRWNQSLEGLRSKGKLDQIREYERMQQQIRREAEQLVRDAKQGARHEELVSIFVALSFQRTVQKGPDQLASPKSKRYVLAMPKMEVVAGKTIQIPLQRAIKEVRNRNGVYVFPAFHATYDLDAHVQGFLSTAEAAGRTPLSGDFDGFDQRMPPQVMWDVAKAMSQWMDKDTANLFLGLMYGDIFKTTVLSPVGIFPEGPSSVKSGSIFTSIGGCMWNYFIQRYGHHAGYYEIEQQCCMGDDFIVDGPGVTPESISEAFDVLGMKAHPDKQYFRRGQVHFLQKQHVLGVPGGMGSFYRILGSLMSVEDDTQMKYDERNRYAYMLQALQRLNNAIFNPMAEVLIGYAKTGDSFQLGANLDPRAILTGAGSYAERKLAEGNRMPWKQQIGYEFGDWAVNRVIRGGELPPPGEQRYKYVYGIPFHSVVNAQQLTAAVAGH